MVLAVMEESAVDGDAVTRADLAAWDREFTSLCWRLDRLFVHSKSRQHARQYLQGLLAPIERKNGWTIAEATGEKEPKAMQRFLNLARWDADELLAVNREYAMEHLADPRAVLAADPTGFAKKGTKSAGVQRQYSGTLGRTDNCQIGTFLSYVTPSRERVLIDRELYVPQSWFADPDRCAEAAIPEKLTFATRPAQVKAMIERARKGGVPFTWFTADEEFGQNPGLREYLETNTIAYVMGIPKNTRFTTATGDTVVIEKHTTRLAPTAWQRRACGIGTKGFRVYDWAVVDSDRSEHHYLIRRNIDTGELAFYHCYDPRRDGFAELVRVAGSRWPIEECFEAGKGEVGLDDYQVRLYHAWYRHVTLAMLAHTFLTVLAHNHAAKRRAKKGTHSLWTTQRESQDQQVAG
jgi:SRSO17 transposase